MWIFVFFDLPTDTKKERKIGSLFRRKIMHNGFTMFQFSVYTRHCYSSSHMKTHTRAVKRLLPENGSVCILTMTDDQFNAMSIFYGKVAIAAETKPEQLRMF